MMCGWFDDFFVMVWEVCKGSDFLIELFSVMVGIYIVEVFGILYFCVFMMLWICICVYFYVFIMFG